MIAVVTTCKKTEAEKNSAGQGNNDATSANPVKKAEDTDLVEAGRREPQPRLINSSLELHSIETFTSNICTIT